MPHRPVTTGHRQLADQLDADNKPTAFPKAPTFAFDKADTMRYGENPHQQAAFFREPNPVAGSIAAYQQLQGKELSYNNIADSDAAWECVKAFRRRPGGAACVIVKHANPAAWRWHFAADAYRRAFSTDPTSAFGGIIAFNCAIDKSTAEAVAGQFAEVIIAPRSPPRHAPCSAQSRTCACSSFLGDVGGP